MRSRHTRPWLAALASLPLCAPAAAQLTGQTVTFQQDVGGYTGTFDRRIGFANATTPADVDGSAVNTDTTSFFLDGERLAADRKDYLIRFDNVPFASGLVPAGAVLLDAQLTLTTTSSAVSNNSQTGGAFNVLRLTKPFSSTSTATTDFGGTVAGVDAADGEIDIPAGSFDRGAVDTPVAADVTRIVETWVSGAAHHGFAVRAETADGWSVHTTGTPTVTSRPKLSVSYTTQPGVVSRRFQQGVNGYAGSFDVNLNSTGDETAGGTVLGSSVSETFIDGANAAGDSPDQPHLLRFGGLFDPGTGVRQGDRILRAELIIATGAASTAADSPGPINVHQLLRAFDAGTTYASLDSNGDTNLTDLNELQASGSIGPMVAQYSGLSDDEIVSVDVTSIVQNWSDGQGNHGFYLGTVDTANGWQLFTNGAADPYFRPELRIIAVPEPAAAALLAAAAGLLARRRRRSPAA